MLHRRRRGKRARPGARASFWIGAGAVEGGGGVEAAVVLIDEAGTYTLEEGKPLRTEAGCGTKAPARCTVKARRDVAEKWRRWCERSSSSVQRMRRDSPGQPREERLAEEAALQRRINHASDRGARSARD